MFVAQPLLSCKRLTVLKKTSFYVITQDREGQWNNVQQVDMRGVKAVEPNESLCRRFVRTLFPPAGKRQQAFYKGETSTAALVNSIPRLFLLRNVANRTFALAYFHVPDFRVLGIRFDPDPKRLKVANGAEAQEILQLTSKFKPQEISVDDEDDASKRKIDRSEEHAEKQRRVKREMQKRIIGRTRRGSPIQVRDRDVPADVLALIGDFSYEDNLDVLANDSRLAKLRVYDVLPPTELGALLNAANPRAVWTTRDETDGSLLTFDIVRLPSNQGHFRVTLREHPLSFTVFQVTTKGFVQQQPVRVITNIEAAARPNQRKISDHPLEIVEQFAVAVPTLATVVSVWNKIHVPFCGGYDYGVSILEAALIAGEQWIDDGHFRGFRLVPLIEDIDNEYKQPEWSMQPPSAEEQAFFDQWWKKRVPAFTTGVWKSGIDALLRNEPEHFKWYPDLAELSAKSAIEILREWIRRRRCDLLELLFSHRNGARIGQRELETMWVKWNL